MKTAPTAEMFADAPAEARPYLLAAARQRFEFDKAMDEARDFVMIILRAHLHYESQLERLIRSAAPRGELLVDDSQLFTFSQKLLIVDAHEAVPRELVAALKGVNAVRNRCVHDLAKQLTDADIVKIGSPLGKKLTELRRDCNFNEIETLRTLISHIAGRLARCVFSAEHGEKALELLKYSPAKQEEAK
jgi:hypothetical protein